MCLVGLNTIPHKLGCAGMEPPLLSSGLDLNFKPCLGPGAQTLCFPAPKGLVTWVGFFLHLQHLQEHSPVYAHTFFHLLSSRPKIPSKPTCTYFLSHQRQDRNNTENLSPTPP